MNGMNSTQFDDAHLGLAMSSVLTFDQKTFDLVARAAFIFESSGQSIFEDFISLTQLILSYRTKSIF